MTWAGKMSVFNGSKGIRTPLLLSDQFKVVMSNMSGKSVLPIDEGFGDPDVLPAQH